jgi:predicted nucleotidyltransferase
MRRSQPSSPRSGPCAVTWAYVASTCFGSAVGESFDPESSDVDFLVEFDIRPGFDYFGTYFGLKEGLERILGRPVDVVSVRNPYFRDRVMQTREPVYAA